VNEAVDGIGSGFDFVVGEIGGDGGADIAFAETAVLKWFYGPGRCIGGEAGFVVARDSEEEIAEGALFVKQQIAFYGSTPAYRPVLELHGWGALQEELNAMTKRGEWEHIGELIDDEILRTFAVIGTPEEAFAELERRYGDIATRITLSLPPERDEQRWAALFDSLRLGAPS